jgi:oligopeptide transport system substrate-binding protein
MRLGQTYHNAFDYQRSRQAYDRGFAIQNYAGGASAEHYARTILRLWLDGPETLAPPFGDDIATEQWHDQLFSGLVEDSDQMVVVPDIARRWSISDGGQTYTFFLRDDARWSDGHPVSAGDFILAWQQMLDPQTPDRLAERLFDIKGARAFHSGQVSDKEHLGLRAPDDQTLIVQLERPASYFLQLLTVAFARPVPQHKLAEHGDNWADPARIVTNGPYLIADWSPEGIVILSRNPHYHGAYGGNVNRAEVKLVDLNNSWQQAVDAFGRRQIDILNATNFPQDAFELAKTSYGQDCVSFPAQSVTGVSFNPYRSPLDDGRVRRAFAMAIDKDEYVQKLLPGQAAPALGGWIPQGLPGHSPDIGLSYDPDFARHLMHEAGYPAGQGFPSLDMLWPDTSSNREQSVYLSQVWQEQLGVNVQVNFVPFHGFIQHMRHDIPPIYMRGWGGDFPDPDNFLGAGLHAVTRTSDAQETIDTARRTTDQNERLNLYRRADNSVIDEALVIPLAYNLRHYFVDSRVRVRRFRKTLRWRDIVAGPD